MIRIRGETVNTASSKLEMEIQPKTHTWLAARCTLKTDVTLRLAHTRPIHLSGENQHWDATEDKALFLKWIDDLIAESKADTKRFARVDQRNEVLAIYKTARNHYVV
jgi:hypothetical protein